LAGGYWYRSRASRFLGLANIKRRPRLLRSELFSNESTIYSIWEDGQFQALNKSLAGSLNARDTLLDYTNKLHLFDWKQVPVIGGAVYGVTHQCLDNSLAWDAKTVPSGITATLSGFRAAVD